jgi:hypothetical protein
MPPEFRTGGRGEAHDVDGLKDELRDTNEELRVAPEIAKARIG